MLAPMGDILKLIWWTVIGLFRSRSSLEAEILTLRLSLLYTLSHWRKAANRAMLRLMRDVLKLISWVVVRLFRSRASLEAEIVALRHQLWLRTRNRPGHRRNCTSPLQRCRCARAHRDCPGRSRPDRGASVDRPLAHHFRRAAQRRDGRRWHRPHGEGALAGRNVGGCANLC